MSKASTLFNCYVGTWFAVTSLILVACTLSASAQQPSTDLAPRRVFTVVEQPPTFPGGNEAMEKYLAENLKFPATANEKFKKRKVLVKFMVTETGTIDSVLVDKPGNKLVDAEIIRVVQNMPAWIPAKQSGHAVAFWNKLPVGFPE